MLATAHPTINFPPHVTISPSPPVMHVSDAIGRRPRQRRWAFRQRPRFQRTALAKRPAFSDRFHLQGASNYCCLTQWVEPASCRGTGILPVSSLGICILPVINIHGRQHAHPTPIHAASDIKASAKDIKPKRSLLHNTTGVASFSTVRPRFPVPLNLLAGPLPAKHAPRGYLKRGTGHR
ncbi:hypothetical protein [Moorena sp. SIO3H5]|uniref:hypothetical protein n=1 Tax=Moorena sp. SIO3H5 TaxID=2607834 RepID=UPI0013BA067F|nr:hypothetical protein [Moorena sp. SIO3H5]NEO69932.1 hypothetical protein [Moorena sp. SIO3H5]